VQRDLRARVTDDDGQGKFANAKFSREETRSSDSQGRKGGTEVTWSAGQTSDAATLVKAFGLSDGAALRRDVAPLSAMPDGKRSSKTVFWLVLALIVIGVLMNLASGDGCDDVRSTFGAASTEYAQCQRNAGSGGSGFRTGGGGFGGWSSGGGHK